MKVTTVTGLYLTYGLLGGIGTGIIYVGVVGLMVPQVIKRFF